ncbi:MAG: OmpA family protein [Pseudomonadota bacterium]
MKSTITMFGAAALAMGLSACANMGAPTRADLVTTPNVCAAKRFDIYFGENADTLTPAARSAIALNATQLQGCRIDAVRVLGLASSTGDTAENQALSERRALAVAQALAAAGWPAPAFDVAAAGDAGAVTSSGAAEPLRRRTEVLVEAVPL